jgi:hypothetical protein
MTGFSLPSWASVPHQEYQSRSSAYLVIDSASSRVQQAVDLIIASARAPSSLHHSTAAHGSKPNITPLFLATHTETISRP